MDGVHGSKTGIVVDVPIIAIMSCVIGIKFALFLLCRAFGGDSESVGALGDDHRNDVVTNGVGIAAILVASRVPSVWWLDSVGAILLSLYIIVTWYLTGRENVSVLSGRAADDEFMLELANVAATHHQAMTLDIVRAYFFGYKFLVELEVVLPATMTVRDAHDIALQLQQSVEAMQKVSRCFVHVDYQKRDHDEHQSPLRSI